MPRPRRTGFYKTMWDYARDLEKRAGHHEQMEAAAHSLAEKAFHNANAKTNTGIAQYIKGLVREAERNGQ